MGDFIKVLVSFNHTGSFEAFRVDNRRLCYNIGAGGMSVLKCKEVRGNQNRTCVKIPLGWLFSMIPLDFGHLIGSMVTGSDFSNILFLYNCFWPGGVVISSYR